MWENYSDQRAQRLHCILFFGLVSWFTFVFLFFLLLIVHTLARAQIKFLQPRNKLHVLVIVATG